MRLSKERTIILIAGGLLLLVGVVYRFSGDIPWPFDNGDEITLEARKISKYRAIANDKDRLEKLIRKNRVNLEKAEQILLSGDTEALAAVDIQNLLNTIAYKSNVDIKSTRILKTEKVDHKGYAGVRVEFSFSAAIRQIMAIVYRIETAGKFLEIKDIRLSVPGGKDPGIINARLVVSGIIKKYE